MVWSSKLTRYIFKFYYINSCLEVIHSRGGLTPNTEITQAAVKRNALKSPTKPRYNNGKKKVCKK